MQRIKQFRCWPSEPEKTDFNNIAIDKLFSGNNIFKIETNEEADFKNIIQIGIQGAPGTRFWLNDGLNSTNIQVLQGIELNWTGIFELDLAPIGGEISSLVIAPGSKNLYLKTDDSTTNYKLIIDILYEDGGVQ